MTKKKPPAKPYKAPPPKPVAIPKPAHNYQCMWGCGYSAGNMNTTRGHEGGCTQNPANK